MTSSMVNTLRIIDSTHERSVSLKSVCTCLQKERDLGGDGRGEGVLFVFLKIKEKPKSLNNDGNQETTNFFLFIPFLKTPTSF